MTVKVKPLMWEGSDADYTRAGCVFGKFEIINTFQDVGFALHCAGGKSVSYYVSLEAAKAAAQADYEARIIAALEPDQTALALVAAAYRKGVQKAFRYAAGDACEDEGCPHYGTAHTHPGDLDPPADAEANLTALLRAEYERGVRDAADKCNALRDHEDTTDEEARGAMLCASDILALLTQEGR